MKLNISYLILMMSLSAKATVTFESAKTFGSGCPTSSAGISTLVTPNAVSVLLDPTFAQINKSKYVIGNPKIESRDCTIETNYHANYDEQYIMTTHDWRGDVSLPASTSAFLKAETWVSYVNNNGSLIKTPVNTQTKSLIGPVSVDQSSFLLTTSAPEMVTECGQSFTLNTKLASSITSTNAVEDSFIAINSLDISQMPSVQKIACLNPWNAEVTQVLNNAINVKITTENPRVNQLASLYVVGFYQGEFYSWTPNSASPWTKIDFNNTDANNLNKVFIPYLSGNAPKIFEFQIQNLISEAKGAVVYVGVGYGPDESSRHKDLLNTLRYKVVHTIP